MSETEYHTDTVGEWVAVLDTLMEGEGHPYRRAKLAEMREALRANRYLFAEPAPVSAPSEPLGCSVVTEGGVLWCAVHERRYSECDPTAVLAGSPFAAPSETPARRSWTCPVCRAWLGSGVAYCEGVAADEEDGGDTTHPCVDYSPVFADAAPSETVEACRIHEHDGAFKCWTHDRLWGAVTRPDEPCGGWDTETVEAREPSRGAETGPIVDVLRRLVEDDIMAVAHVGGVRFHAFLEHHARSIWSMAAQGDIPGLAHVSAVRASEPSEGLREALAGLVSLVERHGWMGKLNGDWACAECKPDSDMIEDGFQCSFHRAKRLAAQGDDRRGPTCMGSHEGGPCAHPRHNHETGAHDMTSERRDVAIELLEWANTWGKSGDSELVDTMREAATLLRELSRQVERLRPRQSDGSTHWEGCHEARGHHECALAKLEEARREGTVARSASAGTAVLSARVEALEAALRDIRSTAEAVAQGMAPTDDLLDEIARRALSPQTEEAGDV